MKNWKKCLKGKRMGNLWDELVPENTWWHFDEEDKLWRPIFEEPTDFEMYLEEITDELIHLLMKKHADYGPLNIANSPGGAINGLRVRMHDKLARINHLFDINEHDDPMNESFEDSFKDLANYAIIGLMVLRGQWKTNEDIRSVQGE